MRSPFDVQTPENLTASKMLKLFVPENSDYYQVEKAGHTFLTGPRGAGKSMFFRYMEPDVQCSNKERALYQLDYYAVYVPVKETELNITELIRLQKMRHATIVLNEHLLVTHIASKIFNSLAERVNFRKLPETATLELNRYTTDCLQTLLKRSGWTDTIDEPNDGTSEAQLKVIIDIFDNVFAQLNSYIKRLAFMHEIQPYDGALFGYADFLVPLIKGLQALDFMPNAPIFLLVDDADNLNEAQASILNSWVARRSTGFLSLKIAAQEGEYKTYISASGQRIEAPHDYSEFNISDKYTSKADKFKDRLQTIVERRLEAFGIDSTPETFFPENKQQEDAITSIANEIKKNWPEQGRGYRPGDDALRYARPEYIRRLGGSSKNTSTYSYAGFTQLVHLSSGIIRHFLESASLMYAEALSRNDKRAVNSIPHSIQNQIAKEYSDNFLFSEFDKVEQEEGEVGVQLDKPAKLKNLINALGGMFSEILVSERSERRVFSIAFSNGPDAEVKEILNLGVKYGYFHRSTIGNKEGTGRVPLYILTRRLAPTFSLDPTGFAGYKFVVNNAVREALYNPKRMVALVKSNGFEKAMTDDSQKDLFEDE